MGRLYRYKGFLMLLLVFGLCLTAEGCQHSSKNDKKKGAAASASAAAGQDASSEEDLPEIKAGGKGKNKSDVPLVIACTKFQKKLNPFTAKSSDDWRAVDLTQLRLLTFDREGAIVQHAIRGERRKFQDEVYSYQGPASIRISYDKEKNQASYLIRLRDDLVFSDGRALTADDVIFSMYAYADSSYQGSMEFKELPVLGMKKYQNDGSDAERIEGIERIDDHKVRVTVAGYRKNDIRKLDIPVCPLHIYGDKKSYNDLADQFGFPRGDVSSLIEEKEFLIGAGPYRFIKQDKDVIYYEANEKYYKGCPQTAFIQLKQIGEITESQKLDALANGDYDVADMPGSDDAVDMITMNNSSGRLNGKVFSGQLYDGEEYAYIGMNAEQVCVDGKPDSTRSKNLRQALAVLISCNKSRITEIYEKGSVPINYPAPNTSWSVPQAADEEYQQAFIKDVQGNVIYNNGMEEEERDEAACRAALGYLKQAGYKIKNGAVKSAPQNTPAEFTIIVPAETPKSGIETLVYITKRLFKQIGLKLIIVEKPLKKAFQKGDCQLWCGYEKTVVDGRLYERYHSEVKEDAAAGSENLFHISDSDLDEYIEDSMVTTKLKKSITLYEQCYEKILEWGVEVPVYQKCDMTVFSSMRVNLETVPGDITPYYDWMQVIEQVEMK